MDKILDFVFEFGIIIPKLRVLHLKFYFNLKIPKNFVHYLQFFEEKNKIGYRVVLSVGVVGSSAPIFLENHGNV